ncbi:MAG: hydrogenase expression/formation C-terminal domain-containing protein [Candidatus Thiodiazotropha sp.]
MEVMSELQLALHRLAGSRAGRNETLNLDALDSENRESIDQLLGEGEVSMHFLNANCQARVRESVLAGVWRVKYFNPEGALTRDTIEVSDVPMLCRRHVFSHAAHRAEINRNAIPEGVESAPSLLAEINEKVAGYRPRQASHVINLNLLAQTEKDLGYLTDRLGKGPLTIRSRGYGNCHITSTAVEHVWWVQHFNSQDKSTLNTLEIGGVPAVAAAAHEDLHDSRQRMAEILETYR